MLPVAGIWGYGSILCVRICASTNDILSSLAGHINVWKEAQSFFSLQIQFVCISGAILVLYVLTKQGMSFFCNPPSPELDFLFVNWNIYK